ncbi:MAG TPA: bifunctional alpha,alpha-trehalose-phosphate synthase (UDP-forming)/trehalose-phosphatase [Tepidisphaeraceae bacterium]|jgi:trehalose 6-phosphate synthase/phosphatase
MKQQLINVSNRLPVTVGDEIKKSSGGLVAALEGLSEKDLSLNWIGWPGAEIEDPQRQQEIERILVEQHQCTPVFLSKAEVEGFYEGFSNSSLWPLLHNMPSRFRYEPDWWNAYVDANRKFCKTVISAAREGDLVWVHDYQLMLLPAMLREAMPSLKIGFFLHTPFPSFELFRYHPKREELLTGLLGSDLVGFHTFSFMRNFRSSVLRQLGLQSEGMNITQEDRSTTLGIFPIGINGPKFERELKSPEFQRELEQFRQSHEGMQVVLSVERLDYTKGLLHRIDAIDLFLSRAADREHVKFIMISVPSRENVGDYKELREEVEFKVGRLNGKYATLHNSPIRFIHGSVTFPELCALYANADIGLVTPLIDGMNLVAKEYIACQQDDDPGVLILSEFAGAAEELFNATIVNPYDTEAMARAMEEALARPVEERRKSMQPMRQRVLEFDARNWARSFIHELAERKTPRRTDGQPIDTARDRLRNAIRASDRVALFLDYDGTLREIELDPDAATPNQAVRETLDALLRVPNLHTWITSGRKRDDLEHFLGDRPLGLIAEHGAALRSPGQTDWQPGDRNVDYSWKESLLKVLQLYERNTPGSFIEIKHTGLVWHYRRANAALGEWRAQQLTEELSVITSDLPVQVRHGRKIVEIAPLAISKGAAVLRAFEHNDYTLALVAGDDITDRSMYQLNDSRILSLNVGSELTGAQFRLPSPAQFRAFLNSIVS